MAAPATTIPQQQQEALKAAIFQRLHPRVYLERFLSEKVRPDGRQFDEWRDVSLNVGRHPLPSVLACPLTPSLPPRLDLNS